MTQSKRLQAEGDTSIPFRRLQTGKLCYNAIIAINVVVLVYDCAELPESSVSRLLPRYRVSCSEPLLDQLKMKEILKKGLQYNTKKNLSSRFYDKVISGSKRDFSCTHGRMCGYELFAPGKTTGYSYYI